MKLLIAGDSITEGETGVDYVNMLIKRFEGTALTIKNLGLGGDTLIGITNRLFEHLKIHNDYDLVIVEAGHNDIILPYFEHGELPFKLTAKAIESRGSYPITDSEIFKQQYENLVRICDEVIECPCFVTTLSCIGEKQSLFTNQKRNHYNAIIKEVTAKSGCNLIDIGIKFDEYLKTLETTDYMMNDFFRAFVFDKNLSDKKASDISTMRGLHLTIDGVHLNEKGASIYAMTIGDAIAPYL